MELWNAATVVIIDAPMIVGDIKERLSYAKHAMIPHDKIKFPLEWKVYDVEDILHWRIDQPDTSSSLLYIRESCMSYVQGKTPCLLQVKVIITDSRWFDFMIS
jgi:hypothetical protein